MTNLALSQLRRRVQRLGPAFVLLVSGAAPALAAENVILHPHWLKKPSAEDMAPLYPEQAGREEVGGKAVVRCNVTAQGTLDNCAVLTESPPELGFGAASLAATKYFQMTPPPRNSAARTAPVVDLPFVWLPPGAGEMGPQHFAAVSAETPTREQVSKAFPKAAIGKVGDGFAVLSCGISPDGSLTACRPTEEQPAQMGFGTAALSLAASFRYVVFAAPGESTKDIVIEVPITFHDPSKPAPPVQILKPTWIHQFDPDKLASIYPNTAIVAGIKTGRGVVECDVAHSGKLTDCRVVREEPPGMGFGAAALKVAAAMAMNPWTENGEPVDGGRIRLPIDLAAPPPAAAPAAKP